MRKCVGVKKTKKKKHQKRGGEADIHGRLGRIEEPITAKIRERVPKRKKAL